MIDFVKIRYARAEDGTIAVNLGDVARGLRRMKNDTLFLEVDAREAMRWAAEFLDALERLLPEKLGLE